MEERIMRRMSESKNGLLHGRKHNVKEAEDNMKLGTEMVKRARKKVEKKDGKNDGRNDGRNEGNER
jgi:hypothetical protein